MNISRPTVLQAIRTLENKSFVEEDGKFQSEGERRAKAVRCIPNAKYAVGIDITKNHVGLVVTDFTEKPIRQKRIAHPFEKSEGYRNFLHDELTGKFPVKAILINDANAAGITEFLQDTTNVSQLIRWGSSLSEV